MIKKIFDVWFFKFLDKNFKSSFMLYWVLASTKSTKVMTFGEPTPKGSVVVDGFIGGGERGGA